jgi:hypothetical protein
MIMGAAAVSGIAPYVRASAGNNQPLQRRRDI